MAQQPPPGYGPPGYGPPGYGPPGYPPVPLPPPRPYDPLIGYDFSSWIDRLKEVVKRSWKPVLKVLFLGSWLPSFVLTLIGGAIAVLAILAIVQGVEIREDEARTVVTVFAVLGLSMLALLAIFAVVGLIAMYFTTVAEVAAIKVIASDAAGQRLPLFETYKNSMRLAFPTFLWLFLASAVTILGFFFCILPMFYLGIALSLVLPIMVFEKRDGFSGSFRLTHSNFWPVAGRIALLFGSVYAVQYVVSAAFDVVSVPFQAMAEDESRADVAIAVVLVIALVQMLVTQAVGLLGQLVTVAGQVVTYAELRGRFQPQLSTAQLAAEANAP